MSNIRNTIINNLVTQLKTIKTSAGFFNNVKLVTRDDQNYANWNSSQLPGIYVYNNLPEEFIDITAGNDRRKLSIRLFCNTEHPKRKIEGGNEFIADVRKALHSADLGTNFLFLRLMDLDSLITDRRFEFAQDVEIYYYYTEATP